MEFLRLTTLAASYRLSVTRFFDFSFLPFFSFSFRSLGERRARGKSRSLQSSVPYPFLRSVSGGSPYRRMSLVIPVLQRNLHYLTVP